MGKEGSTNLAGLAIKDIGRLSAPTKEEFQQRFIKRSQPIVITTMSKNWPALANWSLEKIETEYEDSEVTAASVVNGDPRLTGGKRFEKVSLGKAAKLAHSEGDSLYVMTDLSLLPQLEKDVITPLYCDGAVIVNSKFWLSKAGTVTKLHWDIYPNLHTVVCGAKEILLAPPWKSFFLYPAAPWAPLPNFSKFDPRQPDLPRFPLAQRVTFYRCLLKPGDTLFIPALWWHHVTSVETTISVNFWWAGRLLSQLGYLSSWFKHIRGIYAGEWKKN